MKKKTYEFFNNPWVAFPLMILILVFYMYLGQKLGEVYNKKHHYVSSSVNLPK